MIQSRNALTKTCLASQLVQPILAQPRRETVASRQKVDVIGEYKMPENGGETIPEGRAGGKHIGSGEVHILTNIDRMNEFQNGEVLVPDMLDPDWEPIMKTGAIITNRGGCTCHAATLSRELDIRAVVGCGVATGRVKTGDAVTVSGAEGDKGFTYKGGLEFEGTMRLSDFQSNEYQTTMDAEQYETIGENPSIGFCGCWLCKGPVFGECFAMEANLRPLPPFLISLFRT